MILRIQPVCYYGTRLNEVGEALMKALPRQIQGYRVIPRADGLPMLTKRDLLEKKIFYLEVLTAIASAFGENTLCILPTQAIDEKGRILYGAARDIGKGPAFVSISHKNVFGEIDSNNHVKAVQGVALHEVGHVVGLTHHKKRMKTTTLGVCPMTVQHRLKSRTGAISPQQYVFSWSNPLFCDNCYGELGSIEERLKAQD